MNADAMPKAYNPREVEGRIYRMWLDGGHFTATVVPGKEPFTIVLPPPNITGEIHLGHALTAALEDIMIRWHRMRGDPTLWLPGSDHASIAAQNVVERELAKEGLSRHDLGRERFLERMWEWARKYRHLIIEDHKKLGASLDFTRERFTMDEGPCRAVRTTFVNLYHKKRIYRGERLINWCPRCATALSDLEVVHQETDGHLYFVNYPLEGGETHPPAAIMVATTRPETILGDTGVAVHPSDARYAGVVGRMAILPALGRRIPIVADEAVDPAFGTGAVKVTPAHDPTDFEIGQRQNLPPLNVMNLNATMNAEAGPYADLDRYECRRRLVEDLRRAGLLVRVEPHRHSIGHCQRCNTVVEPLISKQWFVDIQPIAAPAIEVVKNGQIRLVPERFTRVYLNWMENIRDWCISRQLWWGQRIPIWYCEACGAETAPPLEDPRRDPTHCQSCGSPRLVQDPDVLDTWFSSALWPHSTLGWPDLSGDFRYFYPTSVLETGYDILFFWVARMIMMGLENTGRIPFHTVYLHGLVRDEKGEKMSKSKGNVISPLELTDRYGTDAVRYTLATGSTPGNDMKINLQRMEAGRNFANKLWNISRFILLTLAESGEPPTLALGALDRRPLADRWIVSRLNYVVESVSRLLADYQFGEAGRQVYDFIWGEFADWYVELAKLRRQPAEEREGAAISPLPMLLHVLSANLRLLHPYMPFVTEEIWQVFRRETGLFEPEALVIAPYPEADAAAFDDEAERQMGLVMDLIRAIRNARAEFGVEASRWVEAVVAAGPSTALLSSQADAISRLARARPLSIQPRLAAKPDQALALTVDHVEAYLPMAGLVDLAAERAKAQKELADAEADRARVQGRLAAAGFVEKAPPAVVERERERVARLEEHLAKLRERLRALGA